MVIWNLLTTIEVTRISAQLMILLGRERNISRVTRTRSYAPLPISYSLFIESDNCIRAEPKFIFHQPYEYMQAVWKAWFLLYTIFKLRRKERKEGILLIFFLPENSSSSCCLSYHHSPSKKIHLFTTFLLQGKGLPN